MYPQKPVSDMPKKPSLLIASATFLASSFSRNPLLSESNPWNIDVKLSFIVVYFFSGVASAGAGFRVSKFFSSSAVVLAFSPAGFYVFSAALFSPSGCESPAAACEFYSAAGYVPSKVDTSLFKQQKQSVTSWNFGYRKILSSYIEYAFCHRQGWLTWCKASISL